MQQDGERSGVGGQDDDLGDTTVQRLGGLVGSLLQLLVVRRLLDDVEDLLAESCVGGGPGWKKRKMLARGRRGTKFRRNLPADPFSSAILYLVFGRFVREGCE
jgi:hypothetical protein